jgi:hypothetical protein
MSTISNFNGYEFFAATASLAITSSFALGGSGSFVGTFQQITGITITSQSWGLTGSLYSSSISNANINSNTVVDVIPDNAELHNCFKLLNYSPKILVVQVKLQYLQ